jgi:hypothetical protein
VTFRKIGNKNFDERLFPSHSWFPQWAFVVAFLVVFEEANLVELEATALLVAFLVAMNY